MKVDLASLKVGEALPELRAGPISRHDIACYAAGSGDLNQIHVDSDYARENAGLPDVIVHGMYSMGYLGRFIADWVGPGAIESLETRFESILNVGDSLYCTGKIAKMEASGATIRVTVELCGCKTDGSRVVSGHAVALSTGRDEA